MGMEQEVKFLAADGEIFDALAKVEMVAGYPAGAAKTKRFIDVYLDTTDRRILRAGYACRLRQADHGCLLTIKGLGDVSAGGAMHIREEVEAPATPSLIPMDWPPSEARKLVMQLAGDAPLAELFRLQRVRTARRLGAGDDPVAEFCLDEVEVEIKGEVAEQYCEIEAERIGSGSMADLERISEGLLALGLQPSPKSKFHRALALLNAHAHSSHRLSSSLSDEVDGPGVKRDDSLAEAACKILRFHFQVMLDNQTAVRAAEDTEAVHLMRVATRRMRAAVRLFEPAFAPGALKSYRDGLRATARALGDVRDFDVLLKHLHRYRQERSRKQRDALEPLVEAWRGQRAQLHRELNAYLDSEVYCEFIECFGRFLSTAGEGAVERDPLGLSGIEETKANPNVALRQVRVVAGGVIWQRYEVVRAYGPAVKAATVDELHALRIETKYLRYALEFFAEVLGARAPRLIREAIALQDHLGDMHDAHVAAGRLRYFLGDEAHAVLPPKSRQAIEAYVRHLEKQVRSLVKAAPRAWREVGGAGFRRKLAAAMAEL